MKERWISPIGDEGIYEINTAKWRLFRPVINYDMCTSCAICAYRCPVSSIQSKRGSSREIFIDLSYCKGCGICAEECPSRAITMVREDK